MEAAAIAWVVELFKKPFFCIKVITDLVDDVSNGAAHFESNFVRATSTLRQAVIGVLGFVEGKSISQL